MKFRVSPVPGVGLGIYWRETNLQTVLFELPCHGRLVVLDAPPLYHGGLVCRGRIFRRGRDRCGYRKHGHLPVLYPAAGLFNPEPRQLFFLPRQVFRDAQITARGHGGTTFALSRADKKPDGQSAGRAGILGQFGRPAPAICGMAGVSYGRKQTCPSLPRVTTAAAKPVPTRHLERSGNSTAARKW